MIRQMTSRVMRTISKSNFKDWKHDGTPELAVSFVLAIVAFDRYLQYSRQDAVNTHRNDLLNEMLSKEAQKQQEKKASHEKRVEDTGMNDSRNGASVAVTNMKNPTNANIKVTEEYFQKSEVEARHIMASQYRSTKSLYQCVVRKATLPNMFDGSKSLMHVLEGDVLDVLEENIGPSQMYHLCRSQKKKTPVKDVSHDDDNGDDHQNSQNNILCSVGWYPKWFLEKI